MDRNNYIVYIAGGLLGDFFSQLSVIKEKYIKYNKKGLLYLTDIKQNFRKPIEIVYKETYDIVMLQEYILDYKLYSGEDYDINLSSWRNNSLLYNNNFYNIYKSEYEIDWGKTSWITVPYDKKWKNIVLINSVHYRFKNNVKYEDYILQYPNYKFIFISMDKIEYDFFISKTKQLDVEHYCPESLMDAAIAIKSCEFFIGGLSALLCVAYSLHKKSISLGSDIYGDETHHGNMNFLNTSYHY